MPSAIKRTLEFAAPLAFSRFVQVASTFVLMAYIARLGHEALAAGGIISSAQIFINVAIMSPLFVLAPLVGGKCGKNDALGAGNLLQMACIVGLLLSLLLFVLYNYMGEIEAALHQPTAILNEITDFFQGAKWGTFALIINVGAQQFSIGCRAKKLVAALSVMTLATVAIYGYIFVFGVGSFQGLGIYGAGLAWSAAAWTRFIVYLVIFSALPMFKAYQIFQPRIRSWWPAFKTLLKVGGPFAIQMTVDLSVVFIVANLVGLIGITALGAYQIIMQFGLLLIVPMFGIAEATSVLVGHAMGGDNAQEIKTLGFTGVKIGLVLSAIGLLIFGLLPKPLAHVYLNFNSPHALLIYQQVKWLLGLYALSLGFNAIAENLSGALRGLHDTVFSMISEILAKWLILVPLVIIFAFLLHWQLPGVIFASVCSNMFLAVMLMLRWRFRCRTL